MHMLYSSSLLFPLLSQPYFAEKHSHKVKHLLNQILWRIDNTKDAQSKPNGWRKGIEGEKEGKRVIGRESEEERACISVPHCQLSLTQFAPYIEQNVNKSTSSTQHSSIFSSILRALHDIKEAPAPAPTSSTLPLSPCLPLGSSSPQIPFGIWFAYVNYENCPQRVTTE